MQQPSVIRRTTFLLVTLLAVLVAGTARRADAQWGADAAPVGARPAAAATEPWPADTASVTPARRPRTRREGAKRGARVGVLSVAAFTVAALPFALRSDARAVGAGFGTPLLILNGLLTAPIAAGAGAFIGARFPGTTRAAPGPREAPAGVRDTSRAPAAPPLS